MDSQINVQSNPFARNVDALLVWSAGGDLSRKTIPYRPQDTFRQWVRFYVYGYGDPDGLRLRRTLAVLRLPAYRHASMHTLRLRDTGPQKKLFFLFGSSLDKAGARQGQVQAT